MTQFGKGCHLHLIDGSAFIFRAYHALPPLTRKSDGLPVGAVAGFCNLIWNEIGTRGSDAPTHVAVIFDFSSKSFRNELYDLYKAHRPPPPEDLVPQFPLTREATRAFNIACEEMEGFEADDIIATLARLGREAGGRVTIVSSDKDLMQLVGDGVEMFDPIKSRRIGRDGVIEKFGVPPEKVVDVQALLGDAVDNVPGAKGIGEKSAGPIIARLGGIAEIFDPAIRAARVAELARVVGAYTADFEARLGRKVKLSSKKDVTEILRAFHPELSEAETAAPDLPGLAQRGYDAAVWLCEAKDTARLVDTLLPKILEQEEVIRLSRRLVTLDDRVPLAFGIDDLAVREIEPDRLFDFLGRMEFRTLLKRIADRLGVAPPALPDENPGGAAPAALAEAPPAAVPFDHAAYEAVTDMAALGRWIAAIRDCGHVAFDTETTGLDEMRADLVGISLAVAPGRACYIPLAHRPAGGGDLFGTDEILPGQLPLDDVLAALKPVLEDDAILKIGQNLKYDAKIMARHGIMVAPADDTMLMSYAMNAGLHNHGMDELSERYLGHIPIPIKELIGSGKSAVTFDRVPLDKAVAYAAEDADVTLRLWQAFRPQLHRAQVTTVYETLERPLIPVLARMEMQGIKVDRDHLSLMSNAFAQKMAGLEAEIHALAGGPFNVQSPAQVGEILFGRMSLPGGVRTKTGQWSTPADVLEDLATEHDFAGRVLDYRQLQKLKSTYTDALQTAINPETGRVHTSYSISGAITGRLASTDPNLQNIPVRTEEGRRIREAFVAEPGKVLVSLDYSQIELRILAHIAGIEALKQAFREGQDIHAATASEMFGVPMAQMTSDIRRQAKAINFGVIYGISGFGLARNLRIPRDRAQGFIDRYFERFPGIRAYMDATLAFAREKGFVQTLFGRKIHTPEINAKGPSAGFARRAAINAPIQGTAADVIRRAMIRMDRAIAHLPARMLLQVHDELLFEVDEDAADRLVAIAQEVMEGAADPAVRLDVHLAVEAGRGATWAAAH